MDKTTEELKLTTKSIIVVMDIALKCQGPF